MTESAELALNVRVNRLFTTFHSRSETEQTNAAVARSISSLLGRIVAGEELESIRAGAYDTDHSDGALLEAVAQHFDVPAAYLTADAGDSVAAAIDRQLRLLAAARDAGLNGLALRGGGMDLESLTRLLEQISAAPGPV
jgi:hypothetical protein